MSPQSLPVVALLAALSLPALAADPAAPTRFGAVGVAGGNALTFSGKPLTPPVSGNSGLQVFPANVYAVADVDLVVVTDVGGSFCPSMFFVAAVSKAGVKVSKEFGNCSEALDAKVVGGKLVITQPAKKAGAVDSYVFDAASGVVTAKQMVKSDF